MTEPHEPRLSAADGNPAPRRSHETRRLIQRVRAEHAATGRVSPETLAAVAAELHALTYAELHDVVQLISCGEATEACPPGRGAAGPPARGGAAFGASP